MTIAIINANEDQNQYIGQIHEQYYAKLRHYFLIQISDASEADDCAQETICRFFYFMEDRHWETEAEYIDVYLMRIAGFLCSRKLAKKRSPSAVNPESDEIKSLFNKIRAKAINTCQKMIQLKQFLLGSGTTVEPFLMAGRFERIINFKVRARDFAVICNKLSLFLVSLR
jgi:hypothetical protein